MKSGSSTGTLSAERPRGRATTQRTGARARMGGLDQAPRGRTHRRSSEILEAAAKVFAQRGYHGATTQDIADVLGIRQASLYYYFRSKEEALELVCAKSAEGFLTTARAIAKGPGSATERLSGLIRSHISPILDRGDYIKVFLTQRQFLPRTSRRRVAQVSRGIEQTFETVLREGIRCGEFRPDLDARLTMLTILGAANAVSSWYQKEGISLERISADMVRLVLQGVVANPAGRKSARRPR